MARIHSTSLTIEIEYMAKVNWSLLRSGLPLIWKLAVRNRGVASAGDLSLRIRLPDYLDTGPVPLPEIAPGKKYFLDLQALPWIQQDFRAAVQFNHKHREKLQIEIGEHVAVCPIDLLTANEWCAGVACVEYDDGNYAFRLNSTVELYGITINMPPGGKDQRQQFEEEWTGVPPLQAATAALVLPQHSRIAEIKRQAVTILPGIVEQEKISLDEWSKGTPHQRIRVVEAIYEAFVVLYPQSYHDIEDFSLETWSQRIRFPGETLTAIPGRVHGATCVDYALLWCAVLERCGLSPFFVLVGTEAFLCHALVGCRLVDDAPSGALLTESAALQQPGKILLVDITEFSKGAKFSSVCALGGACLEKPYQFCYALDIKAAYTEYKIEPLPWDIPPNFDSDLRTVYLETLYQDSAQLSLGGVDPKAVETDGKAVTTRKADLNLDALYTALLTRTPEEQDRPAAETIRGSETKHLSALDLLNRNSRLVLLGDPGGGKSTFVNFVAMCLAGEALGGRRANLDHLTSPLPDEKGKDQKDLQTWEHGELLPVRVILRDFAARGLPEPGNDAKASHLWDFIVSTLKDSANGEFAGQMKEELKTRGGLIMFDGLDEVPEADRRREQIIQAVESFVGPLRHCRVLVTSRTYAYQNEDWKLDGFEEATLAPFTRGQIIRFVDRWYAHKGKLDGLASDDTDNKADHLKKTIFASKRLQELAERPLLLTLMASLHYSRGELPEKREQLYAESIDLLLEWWERGKEVRTKGGEIIRLDSVTEYLSVDRGKVFNLISRLAFKAYYRQSKHISQQPSSRSAVIPRKALVYGLMRISQKRALNFYAVVDYLRDRAGILISPSGKVYTFPHRTIQEYLAACLLVRLKYPRIAAELARRQSERWREVVLLAGARAGRLAAESHLGDMPVWSLAGELCYREPDDVGAGEEDVWGAHLAGLLLAESARLDRVSKGNRRHLVRIRNWLVRILAENLLTAALERAAAGNCLARLGDPRFRPDAWHLPADDRLGFVEITKDPFLMGSDKKTDKKAIDNEIPQHEVILPAYWIGRYPVTVAQFRDFIEDDGYRPEDNKCLEGVATHPVVYVNWHDAMAYCKWLTQKLQKWPGTPGPLSTLLKKHRWRITLPSEAEWEKAARGTDGRIYPWGDKLDAERANCDDTGIGTTSAVGCFAGGKSPYGCLDMAGNVWEWTRSHLKPYPYDPTDGREVLEAPDSVQRVLRGGASFSGSLVRCALRFNFAPDLAFVSGGFRVVLSPFSSGI